jgi:hypothetical protein
MFEVKGLAGQNDNNDDNNDDNVKLQNKRNYACVLSD